MAALRTPRVVRATVDDVGRGTYPRPLAVAVVCWILLAVVLLISRIGAPQATDDAQAGGTLGPDAVLPPTGEQMWFVSYLPVVGGLVLVLAVILALGFGWARLVLALVGMLSVVGLAAAAQWLAIPAGVLFALAAVSGLFVSAHRYLMGTRPTGSAEPTETVT